MSLRQSQRVFSANNLKTVVPPPPTQLALEERSCNPFTWRGRTKAGFPALPLPAHRQEDLQHHPSAPASRGVSRQRTQPESYFLIPALLGGRAASLALISPRTRCLRASPGRWQAGGGRNAVGTLSPAVETLVGTRGSRTQRGPKNGARLETRLTLPGRVELYTCCRAVWFML